MAGKQLRNIVVIDEEKCNGCGQCITACAEGALAIVNGKAKLISETYCDGLGACLGNCPQGAITVEQREAEEFSEEAVAVHLAKQSQKQFSQPTPQHHSQGLKLSPAPQPPHAHAGCPGAMARSLKSGPIRPITADDSDAPESTLGNWPVQLSLLPVSAPYLDNADLLISADCVAHALPNFHQRFLQGHILTIGCPKLDDTHSYFNKLIEIFQRNNIKSIHVLYMEVPCCTGLVRTVEAALDAANCDIPLTVTRIGINGSILESREIA